MKEAEKKTKERSVAQVARAERQRMFEKAQREGNTAELRRLRARADASLSIPVARPTSSVRVHVTNAKTEATLARISSRRRRLSDVHRLHRRFQEQTAYMERH